MAIGAAPAPSTPVGDRPEFRCHPLGQGFTAGCFKAARRFLFLKSARRKPFRNLPAGSPLIPVTPLVDVGSKQNRDRREARAWNITLMKTEQRLRSLHTFAGATQPAPAEPGNDYDSPTISGYIRRAALDGTATESHRCPAEPASRLQPEIMLAVLSYCYASGIYASAEIENRLWHDDAFLARYDQQLPTAPRIRQFRRQHRQQIIAVIETALRAQRERSAAAPASAIALRDPFTAAAMALENASVADSLDET